MTTQIRIIEGETVIDRDMNDEELAAYKAMQDSVKAQAQADANRQALKEATLAKLGLTADEVAALLS
jgi:phosphopantetheinyl transferase (holo-ACP synthase)